MLKFVPRLPGAFAALVVLALCPGLLAADDGALTETERRIVEAVDARQDQALDLLERAVNINSGSFNLAGVREVGALFDKAFSEAGLETEWLDGSAFDRAGHLVVRNAAAHDVRGPHFLMIGHLDTVFEPDSPFQRFERLDGNLARGPGTTDMKGGNVIILEALRALDAVGALDDMQVTVVLIGDEESSGRPLSLSRAALIEAAREADIALGFEDGDSNPATAVIARRGYTGWQLDVTGTPAHSSLIFRDNIGYGASFEAARILDGFRRELAGEQYLTFNAGLVLTGTTLEHDAANAAGQAFGKPNVIPERGVVTGDLRTLSAEQEASARERMLAIVQDHLPGTSASMTFTDGYPPLAPTEGNRRLLSLYDQASRDLGFGPVTAVDPAAAGAADISFTAGLVDMALDGLGLMGSGGHTTDETADLSTLPSQTKRAALLMYRLAHGESE
ncbi:MAG: peptidase M20 [Xanthomonadales bacterium]|nr:peptidase M20 [Xanthomonadales bacterium]